MRSHGALDVVPPAAAALADPDLADHRARGRDEALVAARGVDGHALTAVVGGAGGIGVSMFAPGCLALALAGRFDDAGVERLRGMAPMLERRSSAELDIDLSELRDCDAALARVIGRLRIRRLADGAWVEVRQPPVAVRRELGERSDTPDETRATIGNPPPRVTARASTTTERGRSRTTEQDHQRSGEDGHPV